jgi:EAL domain-containing protein (putative c-di-GMP-specific phosphodiesterase class I)
MARTLGLTTVAEGIENVAQLDMVQDAGCNAGQGYRFARPGSPETLDGEIASRASLVPHMS